MSEVAYVSEIHLERPAGPLRIARLPGETEPIKFGLHGAIAQHYGIDMARVKEVHATTIDYVVAALAG